MAPANRHLSLLSVDVASAVATITIQRPEALNSLNPAVLHQLQQALGIVVDDPQVSGIVICGAGKAFVVGADINFFVRNLESRDIPRIVKFTELGHRVLNAIDTCPKPVVACVHGHALGGGFELALACDRIVASPRASFGFPEIDLGIYPGLGGTQRTSRAIGIGLAKYLIFTGKVLTAKEASEIGVIDRVVPADQLLETCHRVAVETCRDTARKTRLEKWHALDNFFANNSADALHAGSATTEDNSVLVRAMKMVSGKSLTALRVAEQLIDAGSRGTLETGLQLEIDRIAEVFGTDEVYRRLASHAKP